MPPPSQILPDGAYIELIWFVHPASHYEPGTPARTARDTHQWANKPPGWVSYSFLGVPPADGPLSTFINTRAEREHNGVAYVPEVYGGRTRGDGAVLEWRLTSPRGWWDAVGGSRLPFFCQDLTPRSLRVPVDPKSYREHANGSSSVAYLRLLVPPASFEQLSKELATVVGDPPVAVTPTERYWVLETVPDAGASGQVSHPRLVISTPTAGAEEEEEFVRVRGAGIYEIGFRGPGKGGVSGEGIFGRVNLGQE